MHPNVKLARKISKYYTPIESPADKNDWHVGHQCIPYAESAVRLQDKIQNQHIHN